MGLLLALENLRSLTQKKKVIDLWNILSKILQLFCIHFRDRFKVSASKLYVFSAFQDWLSFLDLLFFFTIYIKENYHLCLPSVCLIPFPLLWKKSCGFFPCSLQYVHFTWIISLWDSCMNRLSLSMWDFPFGKGKALPLNKEKNLHVQKNTMCPWD